MKKIHSNLFSFIFLTFFWVSTAVAEETKISLRLVHPEHDRISFLSPSEANVDKRQYEYFEQDEEIYWVSRKIELDVTDMKGATLRMISPPSKEEIAALAKRQPNMSISLEPYYDVTIVLNKKGQEKFTRLTSDNIMRRLAIIFERRLIIAPIIREKIIGDEVVVSALANYDEATRLRDTINNYSVNKLPKK